MPALESAPYLKPCPFCGCELESKWDRKNPSARCATTDCYGGKLPILALDVSEQVDAWNTRHTPVKEPTIEDNSQNWSGMDGATAWHLIDRHADGWADVAKMMGEWLAANSPPAASVQPVVAWLLTGSTEVFHASEFTPDAENNQNGEWTALGPINTVPTAQAAPVLSAGPITPEMAKWGEVDKAELVSVIAKHTAPGDQAPKKS